MSSGECQTKNKGDYDNEEDNKPIVALDEGNIFILLFTLFKASYI